MKLNMLTRLLALSLGAAAFAQGHSPITMASDPMGARVDQVFAQWDKPTTPGCAVAVISKGKIVYKRGYGTANLELSEPIKTTSVFNAGSIAKQFTAMSILLLAEQGKLSVDDDVRKYIPEVPDFGTPITLRHLLHHTSGLRDFLELLEMAGRRSEDVITENDILQVVARQRTLNNRPGEGYSYSNTGYVLLAVVVQRVAGLRLNEFAEANIFRPLGMMSTHFYDDHRTIIDGLVDAYIPKDGGGFLKWMPLDDHMGSGNLFTTVEDLARWDQNFYDKKVGGSAVIEQMLKPGILKGDPGFDYAFGLIVTHYRGLREIQHSGSRLGYRSQLLRFPDQRFSVVCLCNARISPDAMARQVADIYLADSLRQHQESQSSQIVASPQAAVVPERELASVAGTYWNPVADNVRRVYVNKGKLMFFRAPGNESELAPLGGNRFIMAGTKTRPEIIFRPARGGARLQMVISEPGRQPVVLEEVKTPSYKLHELSEFAGRYYSPELNTTYNLTASGDQLRLQTGNWGDFLLSPRFVDSFANPEEMGSLIFTRNQKNQVSGFVLRSGKVKNLRFERMDNRSR